MSGWQIAVSKKPKSGPSARLYVSLNKRGEIVINPAAWQWIGDVASVTLLYDEELQLIGVKSPIALDRNFFRVRRCGRGRRQRIIYARQMIRQFGIKIKDTLVFRNIQTATYHDHQRILILDLKTAGTVSGRRRSLPG